MISNSFNPANWSTKKLLSITYGLFIVAFLMLVILPITLYSSSVGIIINSVKDVLIGIVLIIFAKPIGSALSEANRRWAIPYAKTVWRMKPEKIDKTFNHWIYSYKFYIWIVRVVGTGLIANAIYLLLVVMR